MFALVVSGWSQPEWIPHLISSEIVNPHSVRFFDVDFDGDLDLVTGSFDDPACLWFEQTSEGFVQQTILADDYCSHAEPVDMDADGDCDIVASSHNGGGLQLIENIDGDFIPRIIDTFSLGCYYHDVVDLDLDGDLDVLAANYYDHETIWLENQNGQFVRHFITDLADGPIRVKAGDMDNDGDLDVVISDYSAVNGVVVATNFSQATEWEVESVFTNYDGAWNISLVDINEDGLLDILTSSHYEGSIDWLENTGESFIHHHHIDLDFARDIQIADVNNDGRLDLIVVTYWDGIYWYDHVGNNWVQNTVNAEFEHTSYLVAADVDGDGDIDFATAAISSDSVILLEQVGSPYPVSYEIVPTQPPYILSPSGGTITYSGSLVNSDATTYPAEHQTWVELPSGNLYGPLSLNIFTITPYMDITVFNLTLDVPANAPAGTYQFIGQLILPEFTLESGFPFHKQEGLAATSGSTDWQASGWPAELGTEEDIVSQPDEYQLHPATPNPFNPVTSIRVTLPSSAELSVMVFNTSGQQVATIAHGSHAAGTHSFEFDGREFGSGVYFVRANVPGQLNAVQKVVYLK